MQAGQDPIEERQRIKDAAKAAEATSKAQKKRQHLTLATAARDYHERVVEPRLTTKHAAQWIVSLELHVPAEVWHKPIAAITAPELLEALSSVRSVEVRGRRVPETLPAKQASEFKALDYRQAPAFMVKLRQAEEVSARCLEFAVLTAARTSEALTAQWSEFDLT